MSYFKRFTDFCAGFAAFVAALFFVRKYMAFEPKESSTGSITPSVSIEAATDLTEQVTEKLPSKLEQFLEPTEKADYSLLIPLILVLLLSAILGRVLKKLPYVCFGISLLPAMMIAYTFETNTLHAQIPLFLIVALLHVIGNIYECLIRDREDGRHRAFIAAKISSAMGAIMCFGVLWKGAQTPPEDADKINHFESKIFSEMTANDVSILTQLGWIFLVILAISLLLYNVYFIDAILSFIPAVFVIYQTAGEYLTLAPLLFCTLAVICTLTHIALMAFENNLSKEEQVLRHSDTKKESL